MKRRLFALLLLSAAAVAQNRFPPINLANSDPSGTGCTIANTLQQYGSNIYICTSGTWQSVAKSAGSVSGLTPAAIPVATGATAIGKNSPLSVDDVNTPTLITNTVAYKGPTITGSVNKVISVIAPPYNAKCDGSTDDQTAIQAAFTAAYSNGMSVQFPAGTCLTSTIVYKGQSFFGAGKGITFIKGKPGQDVFQSPDNTANTLNRAAFVHDLTIQVDVSVNASATAGGGNNTFPNRLAGVKQGGVAFSPAISPSAPVFGQGLCAGRGATVSASSSSVTMTCPNNPISMAIGSIDPAYVIGAPITINGAGAAGGLYTGTISAITSGCTGSTACIFTISPAASTTVSNASGTWLNAHTPTWYIGNAGIALQCSNGSLCTLNALNWYFSNIEFDQVNNSGYIDMNHCAGIFTQVAMPISKFDHLYFQQLYGGYIEAYPNSGAVSTSDTSRYSGMDFFNETLPIITIAGNDRTFTNINTYQEYPLALGPMFLSAAATNSSGSAIWSINGLYMEGGASSAGEFARFMGGPFNVTAANFGQANTGYLEWNATASIWNGVIGGGLHIDGNMNTFIGPQLAAALITDNGLSNAIQNNYVAGTNSYQARPYYVGAKNPRPPLLGFDGSFLATGNGSTPYYNISDLVTTCADWAFGSNPTSTTGSCVSDPSGTEITHGYLQSATATNAFDLVANALGGTLANAWSGAQRIIGTNVPTTKTIVHVMAQCVGAATCTANGRINDAITSTQICFGALSFTSSWSDQTFACDFSSATVGDAINLRLNGWSNAGTNYRVAYFSIAPLNQDQLKGLIAVDSTGAGLTTGPASSTDGDCARYSGTSGKLQDPGPCPAAVVSGVPVWLQNVGDGSGGTLSCPSGTCSAINAGEYWYSSVNIAAGAIQPITTSSSSGAPTIIRSNGTCTIAGTLSGSVNTGGSTGVVGQGNYGGGGGGGGFGAANGTAGSNYTTASATGGGAGGTSGVTGGTGTALPAQLQREFLSFGPSFYGPSNSACGGSGGGAGGSSGGAAGRGGQCIIIVCQTVNFTGTIDVSGQAGGAGGANTGGGGGGAGGAVILRSPNMTNSGTITVTAGAGGAIGTGTSTAGGPGAAGWSKVFSQ